MKSMINTSRGALIAASLACLLLASPWACSDDDTPTGDAAVTADADTGDGTNKPVDPTKLGLSVVCPGAAGCLTNTGDLYAGAAAMSISPDKYEVARVAYYREEGFCPKPTPKAPFGLSRCGELMNNAKYARKDCGTDGVCPKDNLKTRVACGAGTKCPAGLTCNTTAKVCYLVYDKPDADGSENDGVPDWFLDCGRDGVCPCKDPAGQPAYYGKGKKTCLKGHTSNTAYSSPDADGSEGNGKFEGIWMGGFDGDHPLLGKHDDIWARAVVLRTGEVTVALVSLDLVGFFNNHVDQIRKQVADKAKKHGIDYVLVASTHAHEGPDTMGQWGPQANGVPLKTGVDPKLFAHILSQASKAVVTAADKMKKATLTAGSVETGREGFFRDGRDPQIFDTELVALRFAEASGDKTIATLVNWANHPEVLSDTNNYLTSDFPHYLRKAMEEAIPAAGSAAKLPALGGTSIFFPGALGCLMTPLRVKVKDRAGKVHDKSNWDKSEALGINLAVKAREALAKGEKISAPVISAWVKPIKLPVENAMFQMVMGLKIFDRPTYDYNPNLPIDKTNQPKIKTEIAVIRVGPVTFFSMPGEAAPETLVGGYDGSKSYGIKIVDPNNKNPPKLTKAPKGPYLKARVPGKYKFFLGLGNDEIGYIVPAYNFVLGSPPYMDEAPGDHYTETNSLGPQTEPLLLKYYGELLKHVGKK